MVCPGFGDGERGEDVGDVILSKEWRWKERTSSRARRWWRAFASQVNSGPSDRLRLVRPDPAVQYPQECTPHGMRLIRLQGTP